MGLKGIIYSALVVAFLAVAPAVLASDKPATPPAPAAPPPAPARPAAPLLNDQPMQDYTKYFPRREFSLDTGGESFAISYFWRQPDELVDGERYPLVVILHDEKGFAPAANYLLPTEMRKKFPAFIAVPALPRGKIWSFPANFPDDKSLASYGKMKQGLADVAELIHDLTEEHPIDKQRIYVVGCSIGGFGAFGAARHYADIFAAAVPINGGWAAADAPNMTKVPLFVMHGAKNTMFSMALSQNAAYYIQKNRGTVQFLPFPSVGADCSSPLLYTPVMWQWLFKQHKR